MVVVYLFSKKMLTIYEVGIVSINRRHDRHFFFATFWTFSFFFLFGLLEIYIFVLGNLAQLKVMARDIESSQTYRGTWKRLSLFMVKGELSLSTFFLFVFSLEWELVEMRLSP